MMKKLATLAIGSLALFGAQAASATTYSPANTTWVFSGTVDVNKGIALKCTLTLTVNIDAAGTGATATPALSGGTLGLCSTVTFSNAPYLVSYNGAGVLTLHNVYANTITSGDCAGDISATWDDATNTIGIDTTLPEVDPGSGDCTIKGPITLTSPADVTIT